MQKINDLVEKIQILNKKMEDMNNQKKYEKTNNNNNIDINKIKNNEEINKINSTNNRHNDIISIINNKIKENKDSILNILSFKNGMLCLKGKSSVYIIKDNSDLIATFDGYFHLILLLKNGNILASKNMNILIYSDNEFSNPKKINIKCYPRQIEELKDNKLLFLSEESELKILENDIFTDNINIINSKDKKDIKSIKEIDNNEIAILLDNKIKKNCDYKILLFFDLKKKQEIKSLKLQSKVAINDSDILYIFENNLYVCLFDSLFKIDIKNRNQIMKSSGGFSKIYRFGNNFFGIKMNEIYNIVEHNDSIEKEKIYKDTSSCIYCLYQIKENQLILSTEKEIKYYNFH